MKKRINLRKSIFPFVALFQLYLWYSHHASYYFDYKLIDSLSLIIILSTAFLLFQKRIKWNSNWLPAACILVTASSIPFMLEQLQGLWEYNWYLIFGVAILSSAILTVVNTLPFQVITVSLLSLIWLLPVKHNEFQKKYFDKVVGNIETRKGNAEIVKWKNGYWVYYNKELRFSSMDEHIMREAFVQPVMQMIDNKNELKSLIIGNDEGLLTKELSSFNINISIDHILFDSTYHRYLEKFTPLNLKTNSDKKSRFFSISDLHSVISKNRYDIVFVDIPNKKSVYSHQFFEQTFFQQCFKSLNARGFMVVKTGNNYLDPLKINTVNTNIDSAGFDILKYHMQIPTIGQRSWSIGSKSLKKNEMRKAISSVDISTKTKWWNQEAMNLMLSSGNESYFTKNQQP